MLKWKLLKIQKNWNDIKINGWSDLFSPFWNTFEYFWLKYLFLVMIICFSLVNVTPIHNVWFDVEMKIAFRRKWCISCPVHICKTNEPVKKSELFTGPNGHVSPGIWYKMQYAYKKHEVEVEVIRLLCN